MLSGATPSLRVRARCRAVGLRGFVYFVGTHTRSTVPLGRSAAVLGADRTVAEILLLLKSNRVGKGLLGFLEGLKLLPFYSCMLIPVPAGKGHFFN